MLDFILLYLLAPFLVLSVVIFVHEWGHYAMARLFGMAVPVFSVGFGREIAGRTDRNGTRWKICVFPFGGFVTIPEDMGRPLYQRAWVAAAGPLANILFAAVFMFFVFLSFGAPRLSPEIVGVNIKGGAYEVGILPGDRMVSVNHQSLPDDMDGFKKLIREYPERLMPVVIERAEKHMNLSVPIRKMPKVGDFGEDDAQPMMGVVFAGQNLKLSSVHGVEDVDTQGRVAIARAEIIKHLGKSGIINFGKGDDRGDFLVHFDAGLNQGLKDAGSPDYATLVLWDHTQSQFYPVTSVDAAQRSVKLVYDGVRKTIGVIYQILVGKKDTGDLGGMVAISAMTGDVSRVAIDVGPFFIFKLMAVLSINIGFLNLLPLPMLDGGHLTFHAIEAIRGRSPSPKVKGYIYGVGVMFIIGVIIMANVHDISEKLFNR